MRVNTKILPKLFYAGLHLASKPTNDHWTVGCTWRRSPNEIPAGSIRNMAHGMAYEDAADWPIMASAGAVTVESCLGGGWCGPCGDERLTPPGIDWRRTINIYKYTHGSRRRVPA